MPFNAFSFIDDCINGRPIGEDTISEFKSYNVLQSMSMDRRWLKVANMLNNVNFNKLSNDAQAKTFKALRGKQVDNRWCIATVQSTMARDAFVNKVMTVYNMSHNSAVANIRAGVIDRKYVEEAYDVIQSKMPKFAKQK